MSENFRTKLTGYLIFVFFGLFCAVISVLRNSFLELGNLSDILIETSILSFVAFGQAIVIAVGALDLSIGSIASMGAMVTCFLLVESGWGTPEAILAGVFVGGLVGVGNGLMVSRLKINPLIATLGAMFVMVGFLYMLTGGQSYHILPDAFSFLGNGDLFGIPVPILFMGIIFIAAHLFMENTIYGRYLHLIGGNLEACRLAGIDVKKIIFLAFVICGVLSTFSGIILAARQSLGNVDIGERFLLEAFTAAMLGKVVFNGRQRILGTLFGSIFIVTIVNGLTLLGSGPQWMYFAQGLLLLSAILLNYYTKLSIARVTSKPEATLAPST